jgi:hypothetical protein
MTEGRIGFGSRPFYGFALPLFLPHEAFFETAPLGPSENVFSNRGDNLRGVADGLEEILKRPAAGQVDADTTSCIADTRTDLE